MDQGTDSPDDGRWKADGEATAVRSDWGPSTTPTLAVVEAVAAATGREPTDLAPLAERLDTDSLDGLLAGRTAETGPPVSVSFEYAGANVSIDSTGDVAVWFGDERPTRVPGPPRSTSEFHAMLKRLIAAADRNGVSIEGGWPSRNGPEHPDWDVHITEVTKPGEADGAGRV